MIQVKRAYERGSKNGSARFLVERLWPRDVKREICGYSSPRRVPHHSTTLGLGLWSGNKGRGRYELNSESLNVKSR